MYKKIEFIKNYLLPAYPGAVFCAICNGSGTNRRESVIDVGQPCSIVAPNIDLRAFRDNVADSLKFCSAMGWSKKKENVSLTTEDINNSGLSDREIWSKVMEYCYAVGHSNIMAIFPFFSYKGKFDANSVVVPVRVNNVKPDFRRMLLHEDTTGLVKSVPNFSELLNLNISRKLSKHRYMCFVCENMTDRSAVKRVAHEINELVANIRTYCPYNLLNYTKELSITTPFLIDTIAVSFYSLLDVIPIFDVKSIPKSFCLEILLTSSEIPANHIYGGLGSVIFNFLFSAGVENIFEVDGENIRPGNGKSVIDALDLMDTIIENSAPQKIVKASKKSKTEEKICAAS